MLCSSVVEIRGNQKFVYSLIERKQGNQQLGTDVWLSIRPCLPSDLITNIFFPH